MFIAKYDSEISGNNWAKIIYKSLNKYCIEEPIFFEMRPSLLN